MGRFPLFAAIFTHGGDWIFLDLLVTLFFCGGPFTAFSFGLLWMFRLFVLEPKSWSALSDELLDVHFIPLPVFLEEDLRVASHVLPV